MSNEAIKHSYPPPLYLERTKPDDRLDQGEEEMMLTKDPNLGKSTSNTYCASCKRNVWSRVETRPGVITYLCCCYICIIGGVLGCCLIPFCCRTCKDTYHFCSSCNNPLGITPVL